MLPYAETNVSFSGADIIPTFNERVIGEIQSITFSITREKAPVYCMSDPAPKAFSRGKRGIAGSLVFIVFDRDALIEEMKASMGERGIWRPRVDPHMVEVGTWADQMEQQAKGALGRLGERNVGINRDFMDQVFRERPIRYSDEIPPFHITVLANNEYGRAASMRLLFVEILNEGMGFSIDDIVTEKACTFVARDIAYLQKITRS